jgi:uncharacterized protein
VIVDVNADLSRWPFRRTPCDEVPALVEKYQKFGVQQAWVGSLDGLFHRDMGGVNLRLAETCRQERRIRLVPFGSINPMLPDWQEDVRRCAEDHHMPGIRLHPNYHGYKLDDPVAAQVLDLAAERGLIVQLALRMDDIRVQHPFVRIADVEAKPLAALVKDRPTLRLIVLNGMGVLRSADVKTLAATDRVWFEISMLEGVGGVAKLIQTVPMSRVLFGSHVPLFSLESAVFKMREAGLEDAQQQAIEDGNARQLLSAAKRSMYFE